MKHRWLAKRRAQAGGFFWLPCPICGQYFGGHEWRGDGSSIPYIGKPGDPPLDAGELTHHGVGICPDCTQRGIGKDLWSRMESRPVFSKFYREWFAAMDAAGAAS